MNIQKHFMVQHHYDKNQSGHITLISVLFVGAIGLSITMWLISSGVDASKTSLLLSQSSQAKFLADTCVEEALLKIQQSTHFAGSANLSLDNGSCSYTVTNLGGKNKQIITIGTVSVVVRKVKIIIDKINPRINISSWEEVADF